MNSPRPVRTLWHVDIRANGSSISVAWFCADPRSALLHGLSRARETWSPDLPEQLVSVQVSADDGRVVRGTVPLDWDDVIAFPAATCADVQR